LYPELYPAHLETRPNKAKAVFFCLLTAERKSIEVQLFPLAFEALAEIYSLPGLAAVRLQSAAPNRRYTSLWSGVSPPPFNVREGSWRRVKEGSALLSNYCLNLSRIAAAALPLNCW
jgi:hypothetical protein